MKAPAEATIEDLYHLPDDGKAEIVHREVVLIPPTGDDPRYVGDEIFASIELQPKSAR